MKPLPMLFLAITLAALGVFLLRSAPAPAAMKPVESSVAEEQPEPAAEADDAGELASVSGADAGRDDASSEAVAAPDVAAVPEPLAVAAAPTVEDLLEGTVVVERADGALDIGPSGVLTFLLWSDSSGRHEEVDFTHGRFELAIPTDRVIDRITLGEAVVEGRPMKVKAPLRNVSIERSAPCNIVVQEPKASVLEVVEAGTESHLAAIQLATAESFPRDEVVLPARRALRALLATGLQSPIDLGPYVKKSRDHDILVRADGYEWARVPVRPLAGGRQRVELMRSADLTVDVTGVDPKAASLLRARRVGTYGPVVEIGLRKDGPVELFGLRPGTYTITAEIGDHWDDPISLGKTEVVLTEGLTQRGQLRLEAAPTMETATLSGEVHVAQSWGIEQPVLITKLLDTPLGGFDEHQRLKPDPMPSIRPGFDSYRFTKPKLQVGRYSVYLHEPNLPIGVDLPPEGISDFELVVGEPVRLVLHVVDRATGEPAKTKAPTWNVKRPKGTSGGSMESAEYNEALGAFEIVAPVAPIELMLWTWEYLPYQGEVDLTLGVREHTIEVERAAGFILTLVDEEGNEVLFPEDWGMAIKSVDGEGKMSLSSHGDNFAKALVTEPGNYTIELPEIPGFVQPEPYLLEIQPGQLLEAQAILQRR